MSTATNWRRHVARDSLGQVVGSGTWVLHNEMHWAPRQVQRLIHPWKNGEQEVVWAEALAGCSGSHQDRLEFENHSERGSRRASELRAWTRAEIPMLRRALAATARSALQWLDHPRALLASDYAREIFPVILDLDLAKRCEIPPDRACTPENLEDARAAQETLWMLGCILTEPRRYGRSPKIPRTRRGQTQDPSRESRPVPAARYCKVRTGVLGCRVGSPDPQANLDNRTNLVRTRPRIFQNYQFDVETAGEDARDLPETKLREMQRQLSREHRAHVKTLLAQQTDSHYILSLRIQLIKGLEDLGRLEARETCEIKTRIRA